MRNNKDLLDTKFKKYGNYVITAILSNQTKFGIGIIN